MKNRILLTLLFLSLSLIAFTNTMAQDGKSSMMLQPPTTEKKPKVTDINGERMVQSYEEHQAIAEAVFRGEAALASSRIEAHLRFGMESLLPRRS